MPAEITIYDVLNFVSKKAAKHDLNAIRIVMVQRHADLNWQARKQFSRGDRVEFKSRQGLITGFVEKIMTKNIGVRCDVTGLMWRVSPSLLKCMN